MKIQNTAKLVSAVIVCQLAGAIGSLFTFSAIPAWYSMLNKPFFAPPNWVFAPVWTILYALMGVSAYIIWNKGLKNKKVKTALIVFMLQLSLNVLWSFLFFGLRSPLYGLIGIIALFASIIMTYVKFNRISKTASAILVPYIIWVAFAAVLNYYILVLN